MLRDQGKDNEKVLEAIMLEEKIITIIKLKELISSVLLAKTPSEVSALEWWSGARLVPVFNHRS